MELSDTPGSFATGESFVITVDDEQDAPADPDRLREIAARALSACGVARGAHLAITLVGEAQMAELKERALGIHEATDVLAWPMDAVDASPGPFVLGDVVICPAVAERQAAAAGRKAEEETAELLVHGILHLLGWDHDGPDAEHAMFGEQARILSLIPMEHTS